MTNENTNQINIENIFHHVYRNGAEKVVAVPDIIEGGKLAYYCFETDSGRAFARLADPIEKFSQSHSPVNSPEFYSSLRDRDSTSLYRSVFGNHEAGMGTQ